MHALEVSRDFNASAERVFQAWTRPEELKAWHCPADLTVSHAECDARLGGHFMVNMVDGSGFEHRVVGEYLEFDPPQKLVFTWDWVIGGGGGVDTRVTVQIQPLGPDQARLTLRHEFFTDQDCCDGHRLGWQGAIDHLYAHLAAKKGH